MLILALEMVARVFVSVSNDLATDQRVHKVCESLIRHGYEIMLLGRKLSHSPDLTDRPYRFRRFRLPFNRGILFYLFLNLRLFLFLLFKKKGILLSNDLDTLPANYLVSKIRNFPLVYDSHEYFTEVPELIDRKGTKKVWLAIESAILPKLKHAYTVSSLIAKAYKLKYSISMEVIRNFPLTKSVQSGVKQDYIIYQGALNIGRGLEELITAMQWVEEVQLLIAGSGDIERELKNLVLTLQLKNKVVFLGRVSPNELHVITQKARLGLSIEKDMGLNYRFSVPNKIFDYIQAEVPVLYSPLTEVMDLLAPYLLGESLNSHEPKVLANQINSMLKSENYSLWEKECLRAKQEFNWQSEEPKLIKIFNSIGS